MEDKASGFPPYRVLVVDDSPDSADTLAAVLQLTLNCEVQVAYDGRTAVELASEVRPDVVILDITMPGMDGHETVHVLRRLLSSKLPRFIAVTGLAVAENGQRLLSSGFDALLPKPVDIDRMLRLVAGGGPTAPSSAPAY